MALRLFWKWHLKLDEDMQTKLLNENFFCIHLTWNGPFLVRTTRIVINSIFGTNTRVCTHTRMITLTPTYTHTHR